MSHFSGLKSSFDYNDRFCFNRLNNVLVNGQTLRF